MIRQNFNADWTVEKGDGNSQMNSFLGNTQTQTVHLPYDAMIHEARTPDTKNGAQTGFYPGGEYIFQKHFTAPQAWQGKPVSLVFEGVYQTALVYLNGWLLTRNVNGYAEFTVEADPYLKYGADNLLKVIADNSLEPNSRWYTGSGIYRPVRLLVGNKVYLPQDTVRITTREVGEGFALVDVTAQVQSASAVTERVTLQQTICREGMAVLTDRQNLLLQPGESRIVSFRYCVDSPALWSPENPNLYTSTMQVLEGEEELDREETSFGIRTLSIDASHGVRINGQTVKLLGACIHHDNGILGAATLPDAEERRIRQLKEAGFNAIRSSHHPAGRALLDACDGAPVTLHRCIDVSRDLRETYRAAAALGIDTVLTSGGAENCHKGASQLAGLLRLRDELHGPEVLIGAGVNAAIIDELRAALPGARAFHASCKTLLDSGMTFRREGVPMGLPGLDEWHIQQTDAETVRAAKDAVMR